MQVAVAIGQEPDFQRLDQALDVARAGEHGRDHDQGAGCRRNARREVHARQRMRRRQQSGQPVHQRDCELAGGQQREDAERHQRPIGHTVCPRRRQQTAGEEQREQRYRAQIQEQGRSAGPAPESRGQGKARPRGAFQLGPAPVDQVVPDVRRPVVVPLPGRARPRKLDGAAGHRVLGEPTGLRDLLDDVAIAVAAGEIHRGVGRARVRAQGLFDHAHGLDEIAPVHRPEKAQTADAVADRDLVGRLLLVAGAHQLLDAQARLGKLLFDPRQRQGQCGPLSLQAARKLRHERRGHRRIRSRHVRDHQDQALRILAGNLRQLARPRDGHIPIQPAGGDAHRDAAQILDQRQTQHDGDGPQLAQPQRGDRLVRRDETAEAVRVHPSVAVGDGLQGNAIHARQPGGGALRQARQFPAIPLWQVPPGGADLLFDEVEVVEQPLPGRLDAVLRRNRRRQQAAGLDQHALVPGQARQQLVRHASRRQPVGGRETHAVLLHLIGTEEFRPQRRLFGRRLACRAAHAQRASLSGSRLAGANA